ncbi:hypothetical protein PsorP6_019010 [Peronosclerospora sorghi]|nr:hypothetical protein PsorP6_019010 [Peronosclerospora sorghi]
MTEFQTIILAGGRGIRLYPLTEETPKSLLLANHKPLLWYQLQLLESSGFTEALIADKIKRDLIVLAGDLVTDVVLHNVANFHRIHDASVTMLLRQEAPVRNGEKPRRVKDMTDCIALVQGQRK